MAVASFLGEWFEAYTPLPASRMSLHASFAFPQAAGGVGGEVAVRLDVHGEE
jgi:hypothetical protein